VTSGKNLMYEYSSKHVFIMITSDLIIALSLLKGCFMSIEMNASRSRC